MANKKYKDASKPFKWKQSTGDIIVWLVTWYCRYALSYRDLTEMAAERGYKLERSTIYRWVQEYAPEIIKRAKPYIKQVCYSCKCDETYLKIKGKWHYLYRAIDKHGVAGTKVTKNILATESGYENQKHTFGLVILGKVGNIRYEIGYQAAISREAPDHGIKLFIKNSF